MQGDNFDCARVEIGLDQGSLTPIPHAGWKALAEVLSLLRRLAKTILQTRLYLPSAAGVTPKVAPFNFKISGICRAK